MQAIQVYHELQKIQKQCEGKEADVFTEGIIMFLCNTSNDNLLHSILENAGKIASRRINKLTRQAEIARNTATGVVVRTDEIVPKERPSKYRKFPHMAMTASLFVNPDVPYTGPATGREAAIINEIIAHVEHIKKEVLRIPFYDTIRAHSPNLEVYIRSQVQPCSLET